MNLDLNITAYALVPNFPLGSAVAAIQATVTGTAAGNTTPIVQSQPPGAVQFIFPLTVVDTYNYSVAGVDAALDTYGTAVEGSFTTTAPATVTLNLPATVVASQT